jgi:DNA sulfur modification protein DndB
MGSVEYYLTTMKAGEAVRSIRVAEELPKWKEMTIEERVQRELEWKRVEKEIAHFIASDPDRFFGALLVAIYNSEGISFEPLTKLKGLPELYMSVAGSFGFLHFKGGELLFTLDGQHRLKGTDVAISGKGKNGKPVEGLTPNLEVADDDISVILIPYEPALRARKIFNKTNKYAKQTSKGDNIITSEDDAYAITARRLLGSGGYEAVIEEELVNWSSNTLSTRSTQFTTINVLYESGQKLLPATDIQFRPDDEQLDEFYEKLAELWSRLLDKVDIFKKALESPKNLPKLREKYLCLKPAGQLALLTAVQEALEKGLPIAEVATRLNHIPWDLNNDLWQGIMMQGKRIQVGKQAVNFAGRLIAYLIGVPYDEDEQQKLLLDYRRVVEKDPDKPVKAKTLPNQLLSIWRSEES